MRPHIHAVRGEGVDYDELVRDVADHLKVANHKAKPRAYRTGDPAEAVRRRAPRRCACRVARCPRYSGMPTAHSTRRAPSIRCRPPVRPGRSGHLTAMYRGHPVVTSVLPISALVDLEPISLSWLNDKLKLSAREIDEFSPLRHIGKGVPTMVAVGGAELPELVRQSDEYAAACASAGEAVELLHVPGCTHFSILETLARRDGCLAQALVTVAGR
ncbi:hypothetical protein [Burkholderia ubonensis]|uniref:hypothetical protein n=1 Tax=Burkholderia ubonensis TaxID=101571 RepID=UPI0018DF52BF|nr:hypothetical protein [Burkholderia ubonensis]